MGWKIPIRQIRRSLKVHFFKSNPLVPQRISVSTISALPCQSPNRPMRLGFLRTFFIQPTDLHLLSKQALHLNYCLEYPVFALAGSFPTHKFYLNCNGSPHSLIRPKHLSQASRHRLLFSPRSTFPSHSPTNPLTFSGASHKAQCPVLTSLLVRLGINPSMPSDIDGGKASSLIPWIKRTGTLMILFVSLYRLRSLYGEREKGKGRGNVLQLVLEVHFAVAIPVHWNPHQHPPFFFKRLFQR